LIVIVTAKEKKTLTNEMETTWHKSVAAFLKLLHRLPAIYNRVCEPRIGISLSGKCISTVNNFTALFYFTPANIYIYSIPPFGRGT
jgi:hypothetical protein